MRKEIAFIDKYLFSDDFEEVLKTRIAKFTKYFSAISNELYGEEYALKYEKVIKKELTSI